MIYRVEVKDTEYEFKFRLVRDGDQKAATKWVNYDQIAYLDSTVALSPYYTEYSDIKLMSFEDAMKYIAVGRDVTI